MLGRECNPKYSTVEARLMILITALFRINLQTIKVIIILEISKIMMVKIKKSNWDKN